MAEARQNTGSSSTRGTRTDTAHQVPSQSEISRRQTSGELSRFRDPFSMLSDMRREMDRLFNNLGLGFGMGEVAPMFGRDLDRGLWSPQIDMHEHGGKLIIRADLPGMSKDDVHCEIRDNVLILEGERKNEQRDDQRGWSERSYGRFYRTIPLPENVSSDHAKASFQNGVLEITLDAPKKELHSGKKIEIS